MCKVWQKVGKSADVIPNFMDVVVPVGPSAQLENSRGQREDGGENPERCARDVGIT